MRHRVSGRKLGRRSSHRRALFRNQVTDLLKYGKIVTTEAKAKEVRALAEEMISLGKAGDLNARRQALAFVTSEEVVRKLFRETAAKYADRTGGYTRIVKLGPRQGDAALLVQLELV